MKLAVVTSFPAGYPTAEQMLKTFDDNWPGEVDLYIDLDPMSEADVMKAAEEFGQFLPNRNVFINAAWSDDKKAFYEKFKDDGENYRFHVCRFGHKVFALQNVSRQTEYDYLIWLDADVITKKPLPLETLVEWLPDETQAASYLGRKHAPHSECGFVAYNIKFDLLQSMYDCYMKEEVFALPGWTDCDVFDYKLKQYSGKNLAEEVKVDRSIGSDGWHVWPFTALGEYMEHHKGQRKYGKQKVAMIDSLQVKTRNCIPNEEILDNIRENLKHITQWVEYCKPHSESVVIASAGPSLNRQEIAEWAEKGVKILTVKHAISRLDEWGITPWACILLDPRQHVEEFVKSPNKDVVYFVASMVSPNVVKRLLDAGCKVVGYHAFVNAGESELLAKEVGPGTMMISGGSGTSTRSVGLLVECLGFSDIHCYGYDLSYPEKPDMTKKNADGTDKYMEVTLGAHGYKNKVEQRTFWTEGQFLAQAQELRDMYKMEKDFTIRVYGDGIAGWFYQQYLEQKRWFKEFNATVAERKENGRELNEWLSGLSGPAAASGN
jgi:hypothetical protein